MVYQRDPLSVELDPAARDLIDRAIVRYRRKQKNSKLTGWTHGEIANHVSDLFRDDSPDRLSKSERALQRALYHDHRIHKPRKSSGGPWSLQIAWDPPPLLPGMPRRFRMQVHRDTSGRRHADDLPKRESWTKNPALQSGGIGSGRERFTA